MTEFKHSRPADTRTVTTDIELIAFFALIDAAKARGMSRTTLASELLTLGMRTAGILPDNVALHLGRGITPVSGASHGEQIMNGSTS